VVHGGVPARRMEDEMRVKYYVGRLKDSTECEVFSSHVEPTELTVGGKYIYSIGPFHRKMDAVDFVEHKHYLSPILVLSSSFRACKKE
jgi:hypothetical protein